MHFGSFAAPSAPRHVTVRQNIDWSLQAIRWAEEFGFEEAWMGSHVADIREKIAAPDLVMAQALVQTERIRLGPAGYILPYNHPVELAHRVAQLDHMSRGRFQFGIAAGSIPTDLAFFGIDPATGQQRRMLDESLDIILKIWAGEPFDHQGEFWNVRLPDPVGDNYAFHLRPDQLPHPPIAMTGLTPRSSTLRSAGERGFIPMSLNLSPHYVATHWDAIQEGSLAAGRTPTRTTWRVVKEVLVAETDAKARELVHEGPLGEWFRNAYFPQLKVFNMLSLIKRDPDMPDADVTLDYMIDECWLVGSPDTVTAKIERAYEETGGFGYLTFFEFYYGDQPEVWRDSLGLFADQVAAKVAHLVPD